METRRRRFRPSGPFVGSIAGALCGTDPFLPSEQALILFILLGATLGAILGAGFDRLHRRTR